MTISAFTPKVRRTLQDVTPRRWSQDELEEYINEGLRDIAMETMHVRVIEPLSVVSGTTVYTLNHEAIHFDKITTAQDYTITDNQTLTFINPTNEEVEVIYYAYPPEVSYGADSTIPLERDLIEALKYFVLKRCYEKEDSTENFGKATYFDNEYQKALSNSTRWHGNTNVVLAKNDFYK